MFRTGEMVPKSGIYRVTHLRHRLPHEVTLLAGQNFPRCSRCKSAVQFQAVRYARAVNSDPTFRIVIYELPVLEEDDTQEAIAS
jgi:hypothetical protein